MRVLWDSGFPILVLDSACSHSVCSQSARHRSQSPFRVEVSKAKNPGGGIIPEAIADKTNTCSIMEQSVELFLSTSANTE